MTTAGAAARVPVLARRRAGLLLHPTSLPSSVLGDDVDRFMDWLLAAGFTAWQMLPVGPAGRHGSPYSPPSAFAGHVGLLPPPARSAPIEREAMAQFREQQADWLDDWVLFKALHDQHSGRPWWQWPGALRRRSPPALQRFAREHAVALQACRDDQFRFARHWQDLRARAAGRGLLLIGDLPMFVVADSADVWAHPELFRLDAHGRPQFVAGVPPDAFAAQGQCWDTPVFDWEVMQRSRFDWWLRRLRRALHRFDLVRWDHFRGLAATWEIPIGLDGVPAPAVQGHWRAVPGAALLQGLSEALGPLPVIAENLGIITPEVNRLRRDFGLPGLHVLQFAFDGAPDNPHLPVHHEEQGVACTGTHDNDTTLGWWETLDAASRDRVRAVLGGGSAGMPDALIEAALQSRCRLAVIPLQDLLRLGSEARMNRPGVAAAQWRWRYEPARLTAAGAAHWRERVKAAGRA